MPISDISDIGNAMRTEGWNSRWRDQSWVVGYGRGNADPAAPGGVR
jgi:hypothetical protein